MATRALAAVEAVVLGAAVALAPPGIADKATHFTWWGVASLLIFDLCIALRLRRLYAVWYFIAATVACTVALGVVALSFLRCTLLTDAVAEVGPAWYIIGNIALHYYPVTRIMVCEPPASAALAARAHQCLAVAALFLGYLHANAAASVYGCDVPELAVAVAGVGGVVAASLFEGGLHRWNVQARKWARRIV
jgi:hypothetical protein